VLALVRRAGPVPEVPCTCQLAFSTTVANCETKAGYTKTNFALKMKVVFYDLETTGLNPDNNHRDVQICSIGAVYKQTVTFHQYMVPTCTFSRKATEINGMTNYGGNLYLNGDRVPDAVLMEDGLENFSDFLDCSVGDKRPDHDDIVMVAHNNKKFDSVVLENNLIRLEIPWTSKDLYIFDSMDLMRHVRRLCKIQF
jgi:DNA polymerase III alpha subunit (gram-positive type)